MTSVTTLPSMLIISLVALACSSPRPVDSVLDSGPLVADSHSLPPWNRVSADGGRAAPTDRPLVVGFLAVDGVFNSELMAPYDIFHHTVFHHEHGMRVFVVSPGGTPVRSFEGLEIAAHHSFESAPPIDVLVVPSAEHSMDTDLENESLISWVATVGANAHYVVSLCDGAFILAKAGLLDARAVTTFPGDQDAFAEMFPDLDLRRGVRFVHDGPAITGEGGARSYDPALYLVDHLYGEKTARGVGRGMVIDWPADTRDWSVTVIER